MSRELLKVEKWLSHSKDRNRSVFTTLTCSPVWVDMHDGVWKSLLATCRPLLSTITGVGRKSVAVFAASKSRNRQRWRMNPWNLAWTKCIEYRVPKSNDPGGRRLRATQLLLGNVLCKKASCTSTYHPFVRRSIQDGAVEKKRVMISA